MKLTNSAGVQRGLLAMLGILIVLLVLWVLPLSHHKVENRKKSVEALAALQANSVDGLKEVVTDGQAPENVAHRIEVYTARIGEAAVALNPNERKSLVATQRVFARMTPLMAGYEGSLKDLNEAGASTPSTLSSPEVLATRIKLAQRFQAANRALIDFYKSLEKNFRAELDKEHLPDAMKAEVMGGFLRGASIDVNLTIRECDQEIAANLLATLELLKRQWGAWSIQDGGALAFEQDAAFAEYNGLQEKLRAAGARQQEAQKVLLKRADPEVRQKRAK